MKLNNIISENLRRLTLNTKYPNKTLSELCGVNKATVSHWMDIDAPFRPSLENLIKIADYYHVSVDEIVR